MSAKKDPNEKIGGVAPFGLRLLPDLRQKIEEAAGRSGRSLNAEIAARLEDDLARDAGGRVTLRLPDGMLERIRDAAIENGRTMDAEIVATLVEAYPAPMNFSEFAEATKALAEDLLSNPTAEKLTKLHNALQEAHLALQSLEAAQRRPSVEDMDD